MNVNRALDTQKKPKQNDIHSSRCHKTEEESLIAIAHDWKERSKCLQKIEENSSNSLSHIYKFIFPPILHFFYFIFFEKIYQFDSLENYGNQLVTFLSGRNCIKWLLILDKSIKLVHFRDRFAFGSSINDSQTERNIHWIIFYL